nr:DUF6316 family protein [Pseudomonas aeruginosa]
MNGQYFFSTREGTWKVPTSPVSTRAEIDAYIRRMRQSAEIQAPGSPLKRYRRGIYFPAAETFKKGEGKYSRRNAEDKCHRM